MPHITRAPVYLSSHHAEWACSSPMKSQYIAFMSRKERVYSQYRPSQSVVCSKHSTCHPQRTIVEYILISPAVVIRAGCFIVLIPAGKRFANIAILRRLRP
ncbi:hypothetical protein V2G26_015412 [Clonostachys chloroleuca]